MWNLYKVVYFIVCIKFMEKDYLFWGKYNYKYIIFIVMYRRLREERDIYKKIKIKEMGNVL